MEALRKAKDKKGSRVSRRRNLIKDIQALQSKHLEAKIVMAKEEMALKHAIKMEKANLKELEGKLLEKGGELAEKKVQRKALKEEEEERRKQDIKPWQVQDRVQNTKLRLQERLIQDQVAKLGRDIISKKKQLSKLCKQLCTTMNQPSIGSINWTSMEMTFREPQIPTPSVFYPKQKVLRQDHEASKETIKCQKQVASNLVECEDSKDSSEENASYDNSVTVDMLLRLDEEVKDEKFSTSLMKPYVGDIQHHKVATKDALIAKQRDAGLAGCHRGDPWGLDTTPTKQDDSELSKATPVQPFHQVTHSLRHLEINPFASIAPAQKKEAPVCNSYADINGLPFQEIGSKKPSRGIDRNGDIQTSYDGLGNTGSGSVRGGNLPNVNKPVNDFRVQQSTLMQSHKLSMLNTVPVDYYIVPVSTNSPTQVLTYESTNSNNNGNQSGNRVCAGVGRNPVTRSGAMGHLELSDDKNGAPSMASANDSGKFTYGWAQGAVEKNDMFVEDLD